MPPPGGAPYPPGPPGRKKAGRGWVVAVIGLVVVAAVGVLFWQIKARSYAVVNQGDCIAVVASGGIKVYPDITYDQTWKASHIKIVKCADASATYKVVGFVFDMPRTPLMMAKSLCGRVPGARTAMFKGDIDHDGELLCLGPAR